MDSNPNPTSPVDDAIRRAIDHRREYRQISGRLLALSRLIDADDVFLNRLWMANPNALGEPYKALERYGSVLRRMPSGIGFELIETVDPDDLRMQDTDALSPIEREVADRGETMTPFGPRRSE